MGFRHESFTGMGWSYPNGLEVQSPSKNQNLIVAVVGAPAMTASVDNWFCFGRDFFFSFINKRSKSKRGHTRRHRHVGPTFLLLIEAWPPWLHPLATRQMTNFPDLIRFTCQFISLRTTLFFSLFLEHYNIIKQSKKYKNIIYEFS